jgi:hypothetical protein
MVFDKHQLIVAGKYLRYLKNTFCFMMAKYLPILAKDET